MINWDPKAQTALSDEEVIFKQTQSNLYHVRYKLDTPEEALKFILQQPAFMAYGGYDLNQLSEEEIIELANDMLLAMKIALEKKKRKK